MRSSRGQRSRTATREAARSGTGGGAVDILKHRQGNGRERDGRVCAAVTTTLPWERKIVVRYAMPCWLHTAKVRVAQC